MDDEVHMQTLMPITCLMGQLYAQQQAAQGWLIAQGIDRAVAAKYVVNISNFTAFSSSVIVHRLVCTRVGDSVTCAAAGKAVGGCTLAAVATAALIPKRVNTTRARLG